jgi:tRNA nucleotidyltransferase/poly(A) polymerase
MLRAVRHAARSDFSIEKKCLDAIAKNRELLLQVAPMRIFDELKKDLCSGSAAKVLMLLAQTDLLQLFLPELMDAERELLKPDGDFIKTLTFADTQIASGKEITTTDVLTLIALYASKPSAKKNELASIFADQSGIINFMQSCFAKLAVPRKERENITATLLCWFKAINTPSRNLKPQQLTKNPNYNHFLTLLRLTKSSPSLLRRLEGPPLNQRELDPKRSNKNKPKFKNNTKRTTIGLLL